jgi:CubicO group peptidase (beta-lactamase class C family)
MQRWLGAAVVTLVAACWLGVDAQRPRLAEPEWVKRSPLDRPVPAPPRPSGDWLDVRPAGSGADSFGAATKRIADGLPDVRALIVVRHGQVVLERYFGGASRATLFNTKSVTKSVVSALVGIALHEGRIRSLDDPIATWLAADITGRAHPDVKRLTLRHLLTMTTGWRWTENGPETSAWLASRNRVRFMLEQPMDALPGTRFNYSTGVAHLISAILARATGMSISDYAHQRLFNPIGARPGNWGRDSQGLNEGGSELELSARDMARFGLLYLNGGTWRGNSVVPRTWVLESTTPHGRVDYGYLWSYLPAEWGGPAVNAQGYGGQIVSIVPAADAVVVIASTTTDPQNPAMQLLREDLLPALSRLRD